MLVAVVVGEQLLVQGRGLNLVELVVVEIQTTVTVRMEDHPYLLVAVEQVEDREILLEVAVLEAYGGLIPLAQGRVLGQEQAMQGMDPIMLLVAVMGAEEEVVQVVVRAEQVGMAEFRVVVEVEAVVALVPTIQMVELVAVAKSEYGCIK